MTETKRAIWDGQKTRLDRALNELGFAASRNRAASLIEEGKVSIGGKKVFKPSAAVQNGEEIVLASTKEYVSRAAQKLVHALDTFGVTVADKLALDVGASTGGFTQVLLERGAKIVVALDVGHDQLHPDVREDARVKVVEGFNARGLSAAAFLEMADTTVLADLLVTDVSFISLTLLFEAFKSVTKEKADLVILVKPQFEVGKEKIKQGVVKDPRLHEEVLERVSKFAVDSGLSLKALACSPITGSAGNVEYLLHTTNEIGEYRREWLETIKKTVTEGQPGGEQQH